MKILTLVGSMRRNGNTARIVRLIERQMHVAAARENAPMEFETIHLGHQNIQLCQGCRLCFDRGEEHCPLHDDLSTIKARMSIADGIIVATPVYVNDVSGVVKIWLDRLAHVNHRPQFAGKCAYLVATVGDGPSSHALKTMDMALRGWGYHIVGKTGFKTGARMGQREMEVRYQDTAGKIGQRLFYAINKRTFAHPSFLSLMTFRIQQRYWQQNAVQRSVDFDYWKSRGWTDPHRQFYIPHETNRVKVVCARLLGSVVARFVT